MLLREFHGQATTTIDTNPRNAFAAITQVERLADWNKRIAAVVRAPRTPLAEGVEWVVRMSVPPARWDSRSGVTGIDADRFVFEYTSQTDDGNPSYITWRWTVEPDPGGAKLTVQWAGYPKTFWRQLLFAKLRRRQLESEVPSSLDALAYHLAPAEVA
jgi:Polyketide cyclase / dehydrase and lipid transport